MNLIAIKLLHIYKRTISPYMPGRCRFEPTCSAYAAESFETYRFPKASAKVIIRLLKCNPVFKIGYDPVNVPTMKETKYKSETFKNIY
tara:strand:+ start:239 stop:502 length:264 start_codon:yes stop_codon:yes gene_type:complete